MKRISIQISIFSILFFSTSSVMGQYNEEIDNDLLKNHKGEIIFSTSNIDLENYNENNVKKSFDLSDNIIAQVVLKKTLSQSYDEHNYVYDFKDVSYMYNYALRLKVDGNKTGRWLAELPQNYFNYAFTFDIILFTDDPKIKRDNSDFLNDWVNVVSALDEGKREFELEIIPVYKDLVGDKHPVLAKGSFTLDIDMDNMEAFLDEKTTDLPPATFINPSVEEKILIASDDIYPYSDPLSAYITDVKEDFSYSTDEMGNILSRSIIGSVVYRFNNINECWVKSAIYTQKHEGYGNFGPMIYFKETDGYYDYQIPCRKVVRTE